MDNELCSFQLTTELVNTLAAITEAVGRLSGIILTKPDPILRRKNRIRTIHASLALEGNMLTPEQITALIEGKRVLGPQQDILEVKNAIDVYRRLDQFDPFSLSSLLEAHGVIMHDLVFPLGAFRKNAIGVIREKDIFHEAPNWKRVEPMMQTLFEYLRNGTDHLLIKSCRFHYQFEYIHPFTDGNGRMGRLWQTRLLMKYHPIFEFIPVEHLVRERKTDYYRKLVLGDDTGDCTDFIAFMLQQIHESVQQVQKNTRAVILTASDRLELARSKFAEETFSRKDYQNLIKTISSATASRDLQYGVETGLLHRSGDKRTAVYTFSEGNS